MKPILTVTELLAWCSKAPAGTRLDAKAVADILEADTPSVAHGLPDTGEKVSTAVQTSGGWRATLWTVDADVRLGVREVAEALGRPASFVYSHTKGLDAIPHRKLDGVLVFVAGELRAWICNREHVVAPGPSDTRTLSISRTPRT